MLRNQGSYRSLLGLRSSASYYFDNYGDLTLLAFLEYVPSQYIFGSREEIWDHVVADCVVALFFTPPDLTEGSLLADNFPFASFRCDTHNKLLAVLERNPAVNSFSLG